MAGRTDGPGTWRPGDRLRRAFLPPPSALRRSSDRVETVARWLALMLFVLSVPVLLAVGTSHVQLVRDTAAVVRATAHRVDATVVGVRPGSTDARGERTGLTGLTVRWTEADGTLRTAPDRTYGQARIGQHRALWVDGSGERIQAPATEAGAIFRGALLVAGLAAGEALLLGALLWLLRALLDRVRLRQWDEQWAAFVRRGGRGVTG